MRHLKRDRQRQLYQPAKLTVFIPRHLINQLLHALLLDGIGVQFLILQQILQYGSRPWGMAVKQVVANNFLSVAVHIGGRGVHVQYVALLVTHRDGNTFQFFKILVHKIQKEGLAFSLMTSPYIINDYLHCKAANAIL